MSNIFKAFVLARPVKTPLNFGHNDNIVIESIDFDDRKKKGIVVKANTFIKLTKINPEDKSIIANTEINFWNLDPTKDFVFDNFISQFSILCGVIDATGGDVGTYDTEVLSIVKGEDDSEMLTFLKKPANAKVAQKALIDGFKKQMKGKIGLDSALLKCKMISNKSGYLQAANDMMWILSMDSEETLPAMSSRELRTYKNALESDGKSTPDSTGKAPADKTDPKPESNTSANSLAGI